MTVVERIRPCSDCGRMTRPSTERVEDHPGTVVRGARNLCITCYYHHRPTPTTVAPRFTRLAYDVVFAVVPDARYPQQSDCRTSCCRNPFLCRTGYRCACDGEEQ